MKTIAEFFKDLREPTPKWIKEYKNGDKPSFKEIVNSGRVVFYPGARYDGQPIKTFNIAHYAHIFFYVDYLTTKEEIKDILLRDNTIKGYKNIGIIEYQERELSPRGWTPHYNTDI